MGFYRKSPEQMSSRELAALLLSKQASLLLYQTAVMNNELNGYGDSPNTQSQRRAIVQLSCEMNMIRAHLTSRTNGRMEREGEQT